MAGGTFKASAPKVRPGTYVNVVNGNQPAQADAIDGIAVIPLIGYDWGPREEWIHLYASAPDAERAKLGRSIYDDNDMMVMLRLLFLNATEVYVYIPGSGEKAKGTVTLEDGTAEVTAKYPGALGNTVKIASVANPLGGFDVSVILNGTEAEVIEGAKKVSDLAGSAYIDVSGEGTLTAFASVSLSGGKEAEGNGSVAKFLDKCERVKFHCMAFPTTEESLITAAVSKIRYIRNSIGWKCHAVVANTAADFEGIYNLGNSFAYEGRSLTPAQATAWLAGAVARADYTTSLTYAVVSGATGVLGEKTNEEAAQSIKSGECFFSVDEAGNVILEYDCNSKVTFEPEDPPDIYKGRSCRVYDTFANELLTTFVPGKFDNTSDGWSVMEGLGKAILQRYQDDGAIQNVDLDADFVIDRGQSSGDSVSINAGIQAVNSAEKYYFTVVTK